MQEGKVANLIPSHLCWLERSHKLGKIRNKNYLDWEKKNKEFLEQALLLQTEISPAFSVTVSEGNKKHAAEHKCALKF